MDKRRKGSAEKVSLRTFYVLTMVCTMLFLLYWLVGYDRPFADNPNFNAPLFTDAILLLGYGSIVGAVGIAIWSVGRTLRLRGKSESHHNNIPVKRMNYIVAFGVCALLLTSFLVGSSAGLVINGITYADGFWLKIADMFIYTSGCMIIGAVGAVVYGATKYTRRP